jgi:hypothetical protein
MACLAAIRNSGERGGLPYDDWHRVGAALHSADPSTSMLAEWDGWSRTSGKYVDGECARVWAGFTEKRDKRATVGTLVFMAKQNGVDVYPRKRDPKPQRRSAAPPPLAVVGSSEHFVLLRRKRVSA